MKIILIVCFGFLLVACDSPDSVLRTRHICTCQEKEQVQVFVKSSIKDANNMSDEEMEDVIWALYKTGVMLNCKERPVYITSPSNGAWIIDYSKTKLDSCESVMDL